MKRLAAITITGLIFASSALSALGQSSQNLTEYKARGLFKKIATQSGEKIKEQNNLANTDQRIAKLKGKANAEIQRRITSLTQVINKIKEVKRLSESQKTALINNINNEIDSLNQLNSKIQADTDINTLREDIKSIVTSYRIYLLYIPETRIIIAADGILNAADKYTSLSANLQTKINAVKNSGKDTSGLQATLNDMQAKISDAKTQGNNAISTVSQLTPGSYPGNKSSLQSARTMLQAAWKDLISARQDAQRIIVALRKLNKKEAVTPTYIPSGTTSAKPTQ